MKTLAAFLALSAAGSAQEMFPFQLPWDDASESATNIAWLNDKPAARDGFVHVKEGHLFTGGKRILITATGDIENTGMGWKDVEKSSLGRDWGRAPVPVEGPAAKITLPGGGSFKAWALDERGQRREPVPVKDGTLEIGPQWKTLWYEVERE